MEQLSGLDAAFVHQDSARTPMHVSAVLVYDASSKQLATRHLRKLVTDRLWQEPLLQRKLQRVTFDVDTPYWIPAGKTDWSYHLNESALAQGNSWEAFHQLLQRIHSRPMDLTRPLWQLHLVDALNDAPDLPARCQVLILKAHHAAIDGISLARLLQRLQDGTGEDNSSPAPTPPRPQSWEVWSRASLNSINRQLKLADTMSRLISGLPRAREERRDNQSVIATLRYRSRFNDRVSSGRTAGILLLPRQKMLAIKRAVRGVTHNDIAASIIAGGLRQYLADNGDLPRESLVAGMPINLRNADGAKSGSNQIATMAVGLATSIEDPVERVKMIHSFALAGKRQIKALGTGTIMDISDSVSPSVLAEGIRTLALASRLAPVPVPFHTMVSNVPGPGGEQAINGLPLVACAGLGPVRDNMGLFHIISSSDQKVSLSFNACSRLLPDGEAYRNAIENSFHELYSGASQLSSRHDPTQ
jgi:diacylglycerol O-acyltransferase / wax synthase